MIAAFLAAFCVAAAMVLLTPPRMRLAAVRVASPRSENGSDPFRDSRVDLWRDAWRDVIRRWRREDQRELVVRVADGWVAHLTAGRPVTGSLASALERASPSLADAARRIHLGADPGVVLAACAQRRGAEGFAALAACWQVTDGVGGPLAHTLRRSTAALRAEQAVHAEIETQLAGPRATARMVALLPLIGPGLGLLIGADSVHVLTATPTGRILLLAGLGLDVLGIWWVRRLIRSARRAT